jgi:hypothetical protein
LLFVVHMMLAKLMGLSELQITKEEAANLGTATANVARAIINGR